MKTIINLSSKNYGELTYISDEKRDLMLICPGGGYEYTSLREAEVVAIEFREKGFHTLTYYYRESKLLYPETSIEAYELLNKLKKMPNIGRIFICGFSVLKAVGVKDKNEIEQRVVQTLSDVGLADKGNEKTYNLSEGEMQRVVVARAIVNNPEIIIADEPTGNLDPITSEEIVKLLLKINQERKTTVIMATHDYIVIEKFRQRVICCENGKVIS